MKKPYWNIWDDFLFLVLLLMLLVPSDAGAQSRVVTDCIAPGMAYSNNDLGRPVTQDLQGRPCASVLERDLYPVGATPVTGSGVGTTGAVTATLAAVAGKTTYVCGANVRSNATAALTGNVTIAGTITGTMNFTHWVSPAASGLGQTEPYFYPCIPASAQNTAIVVTSPAPGAGGVNSASAWGYQQ